MLLWLACTDERAHPDAPGTSSADDCPAVVATAVTESPNQGLERRITVDLDAPGDAYALCTSPDDPEEQILVEAGATGTRHELIVRGLAADLPYTCAVRATCGGAAAEVGFTAERPPIPTLRVEHPEGATGVWTLFNTQEGAQTEIGSWLVIVDPQGRVRWAYLVAGELVADIDVEVEDGGRTVHVGGGWAWFREDQPNRGVFRDLDLSGNTLLERAAPDFGLGFNHHSEKLDDGTYLSNVGSEDHSATDEWHGVGIEQWDPERGVVWSWDSQQLVDAGVLAPPDDPSQDTPWHANALWRGVDPWGEAVWVSTYIAKELWRIDPATGARTHVFGATGDFALQDPSGAPLGPEDFTWITHDPDYSADGRLLAIDNGQGRPVPTPYSRVAEFRLDLDANVATLLWDWTEPGWYDPVQGDADWLPSGNVLLTKSFNQPRTPTSDDASQVLELRPPSGSDPGEVVWRMTWSDQAWQVFRAERYDGCLLFSNGRYCGATADRIAALDRLR